MPVRRAAAVALAFVALVVAGPASAEGSDPNAPQIFFGAPLDGAQFFQGQSVQAAYGCTPGALGWPVLSCVGDTAIGDALDTWTAGVHMFTVRAEDAGGSITTVTHTYTVFDVIAPQITATAPAQHAAYEFGSTVYVDYRCDDPGGTGVQACIGSQPVGLPLPTNHLGTFTFDIFAIDGAGNRTTTEVTYDVVDHTPPTLTVNSPAAPTGDRLAQYVLGQIVAADFSCSDGTGSGIAVCYSDDAASGSPLDTSTVGTHVFEAEAWDFAHNITTLTRSYQVVYAFDGFFAPLGPSATARAGDTVPVKFSLHGDHGLGAVTSVSSRPVDCATGAATGDASAAAGALAYNPGPDRYAFQWTTDRGWTGTCRQVAVSLDDGTTHRASIRFTK